MKKIIVILSLVTLCFSCGSDKKEKKETDVVKKEEVKKEEPKYNFAKAEVNLLEDPSLINLSAVPHSFEDDIVFEEINVLKTAENTHTLVFVINDKMTNFDKLKEWKIGMYFFAKDPTKFENASDAKKGYKTTGTLADPKMMGDEVVVVLEGFKIIPKEISLLRLYLYNNNNDMNKNYYNTKDVVLP
ncbi:hypothetical protein [Kordia sp.]|uniref:hypothetical protein n=1 Tax=Kordia sp. TaxID=1965332 RepID=UPI003D286BA5